MHVCISTGTHTHALGRTASLSPGPTATNLNRCSCLQVRPDGTFHAAGGASIASADAVSNPLLQALTGGAFDNRPEAATTTYTQIPLLLREFVRSQRRA